MLSSILALRGGGKKVRDIKIEGKESLNTESGSVSKKRKPKREGEREKDQGSPEPPVRIERERKMKGEKESQDEVDSDVEGLWYQESDANSTSSDGDTSSWIRELDPEPVAREVIQCSKLIR